MSRADLTRYIRENKGSEITISLPCKSTERVFPFVFAFEKRFLLPTKNIALARQSQGRVKSKKTLKTPFPTPIFRSYCFLVS